MTGQEHVQPPPPQPPPAVVQGGRLTRVLMFLVKAVGLAIGAHEGFTTKDPVTLAFAAFLVAGGTFSETFVLGLIDRIFGRE